MTNPNESVRVWNRACGALSGPYVPREGDGVLAAVIRFDSLAQSGGVLHAVKALREDEVNRAVVGYAEFGFLSVVALVAKARDVLAMDADEAHERWLDEEYAARVPDLLRSFEQHWAANRGRYAPA